MDQELIDMADMYANVCTQQEEKFGTWHRWGLPWSVRDCEAAFQLCKEQNVYPYHHSTRKRQGVATQGVHLLRVLARQHNFAPTEAWAYDWDMSIGREWR